jgi:integrase
MAVNGSQKDKGNMRTKTGTELVAVAGGALGMPIELIESARNYAKAAKASRTVAAYRAAWRAFEAWCESQGLSAMPAAPEAVGLYLAARADAGRKPATLALDVSAIGQAHKAAGQPSPTSAACVIGVLAGIRRTVGVAQRQAAPFMGSDLRRISEILPAGLIGARDRALLLVGFAGAFRRSELVGLDVADLSFTAEGLAVLVRRSKTDQEGEGRTVAVPFSGTPATCPVRSLRAWLEASGITSGPVFRSVTRHGGIRNKALTGRAVALVVKRTAKALGLDASRFSGHSLRAGLVTSAAKRGKSASAIMRTTGHKSERMVRRYIRDAEMWADNAAAGLLD